MIKNFLKISLRYLLRHKEYTAINMLGLSVSITCCILVMLFVHSELSYDAFHSKAARLYRVWQREKVNSKINDNVITPLPLGEAIKTGFTQAEASCRIFNFNPIIKVGQNSFTENVDMVDPCFFSMFDLPIIEGGSNPLALNTSIVITPATAKKYFGSNTDGYRGALGKTIQVFLNEDTLLFTVRGIVAEAPEASSIKYQALIPFSSATHLFQPMAFHSWFDVFSETYVLLKPGVSPQVMEGKFPAMMEQQLGSDFGKEEFTIHLQPITDIHLNTSLPAGNEPISDPKYSYILETIGFLILIVACINFITLSIGQSTKRALEVGVRKSLGAERRQLIFQFWGEAFLVVLLSTVIGLGLAALILNPFNLLVSKHLVISFDPFFILSCLILLTVIAIFSGVYPALILSGFKPVEVLKGKISIKGGKGWLRQALVVGQFAASIVMIIGTVVIGQQMHYLQTKDLGYKKEQVVVVSTNKSRKIGLPLAALYRTELMKHSQVLNASVSVYSLIETPWIGLKYTDQNKQSQTFQFNAIDANFIPAMGIKMASGRNFAPDNSVDNAGTALVNETYVKQFNLTNPIGRKLPGPFSQQIVGVVKDFNFESLHTKIQPLAMSGNADTMMRHAGDITVNSPLQPHISVRLKAGSLSDNIGILKQAWAAVAPGQDFDYKFLDDAIAAQYQQEQRTNMIVQIASVLSIFIACMGLFGLATLSVVKRVKEIGVRKVLGASTGAIVQLLSKDFVILVLIAALVASPVAWWTMNSWLRDFTYRVDISWWVFILAGVAAMLVALATVSYHAIKAALVNPVKSLRSE